MLPTPVSAETPEHHPTVGLPSSSPLQACPHCEALIDTTEREPLERIPCPGCGATIEMSGDIAGLQLVEIAGRGGMGVVYKAYDPSLDRYIAIKLLRKDHSADHRLIEQLETEATITASINDPNVVRVYATGFDRGRFYLAMELVDKGSLDDLIHVQGRVAEAQVLQVGIQIAQGLRAALQHGLIHRDVKPGNILFADSHTCKIVDFGLALFLEQGSDSSGEIWGTPYYIPPEKLEGGNEDFRSDLYSLGASLFHALAGRPPFEAETATLVALKHLKSQVVSLQAFAPWVSNSTAHIINRTLAKNPADRFQSYDDLIHNMEYALEQLESGVGKAQNRARVVLETEDDHKSWTWVVLGMIAVIVVLLGVFIFARPKTAQAAATTPAKSTSNGTVALGGRFALGNEINLLASRDAKAAALLQTAAAKESLPPADRAWAQLFAGAAQLVSSNESAARAAFGKVAALTQSVKDEPLATFLRDLGGRLTQPAPIAPTEVQKYRKENYEAAAFLLVGLHDWQAGALDDGASLLRQFRSTSISTNYTWLNDLKPLATDTLEELLKFQMAADQLKAAGNSGERYAAAEALRKLGNVFKNRTEEVIAPFARELAEYEKSLTALPEPGVYRVVNKHSNLVLDVAEHKMERGGKVHQWSYGGGVNQLWELIPVTGDTFKLKSAHSGMLLNLKNSSTTPGDPVWQWSDDGTSAGLWRIEPKGDRWFFIRSVSSNQVLAVDHMSTDNGGSVTQWDKPGSEDHFWRFERVGDRAGEWCASDIGDVKTPGKTVADGQTITLEAHDGDIWDRSDSCRFVYQEVIGDFDLVAHVASFSAEEGWAKAGLMIRHSVTSDSPDFLVGLTKEHGLLQLRRPANNTETSQDPERKGEAVPTWLKLSRRGDQLISYQSADGQTWTQLASEKTSIRREAAVGFVASSWKNGRHLTVTFDHVALSRP